MSVRLFIFLVAAIGCSGTSAAQNGIAVYGGAGLSRLQFADFEQFVTNYNDPAYIGTNVGKELKFRQMGYGYEAGAFFRGAGFTFGAGFSKTTTFASVAEVAEGERKIQFVNWNYNALVGYQIAKVVMPYFTFAFSPMHIHSYFDYNGVESYGSEKTLTGVYSSWKGIFTTGVRVEKKFGRFAPYLDINFALTKKKYLGGSFDLTTNSTQDYSFPQDPENGASIDPDLAMHDSYRNMRLTAGLIIYLFQFED
jgi:hypothetical protein